MEIFHSWENFKSLIELKKLLIQYTEDNFKYIIFASDSESLNYFTEIWKDTSKVDGLNTTQNNIDLIDFETNYKETANQSLPSTPIDIEGKRIFRAESKPLNTTTIFTGCGDGTDIGNGKCLTWDFSTEDDIFTMPLGSIEKRKRIEFTFLDDTWVKEGTLYFFNTLKGSYVDFYVVCPQGQYYLDNAGNVQQAEEDTPIVHYGIKIHMQGNCPMGDELKTETCSNKIPAGYKFRLDITVPLADVLSNGYVALQVYRTRSVILD